MQLCIFTEPRGASRDDLRRGAMAPRHIDVELEHQCLRRSDIVDVALTSVFQ